ncbi:hypothetical protein SAMN04489798_4981 [Pseudomonas arsenicoxydans]|uniref:3-isopropylmalate dehydratase n=1 Tax=Pseudomonas arsenicoxydans TaxID=702115 RepID=A0A1H0QQM2_9PSED|nr:hypothetical protein [Pseudomonas arsenicoxydans]SDP19644.1 hypothetical protein SAMN04489798_4981 [Pseudomonas arsenicoxydans]
MRRIIATAALLLTLGGCETSPMLVSEARPVPANDMYAIKIEDAEDSGRLTIFRDDGFVGAGCDAVFYIDGQRAAKIGPGQKASFILPAGEVKLGTGLAESGLCAGAAIKTVAANIRPRKEVIYQINWDSQGFDLGPYVEDRR